MPRVRLKGIHTVRSKLAGGKVATYHHHRATGIRLPDDPATPAFLAAVAAAEASTSKRLDRTVSGLIREFCGSKVWDNFRQSTRDIMALNIKAVEKKFGTFPRAAMTDSMTRVEDLDWNEAVAKGTPQAADAKLAAFARVLKFGFDRGRSERNPLETFTWAYSVDRSDMIWLPEHVDQLTRTAPSEIWRAMMLALHTGQHYGELLRLPWSAYDGRAITLRQSKTTARVFVLRTAALRAMLDALPRSGSLTVLVNAQGRPWTSDAFKKGWAKAVGGDTFDGLHFHDLRGTAVTMLSETEDSIQDIAAITGAASPERKRSWTSIYPERNIWRKVPSRSWRTIPGTTLQNAC